MKLQRIWQSLRGRKRKENADSAQQTNLDQRKTVLETPSNIPDSQAEAQAFPPHEKEAASLVQAGKDRSDDQSIGLVKVNLSSQVEVGYALYYLLDQSAQSDSSGLNEREKQNMMDFLQRQELMNSLGVQLDIYKLMQAGKGQCLSEFAFNTLHHSEHREAISILLEKTFNAAPDDNALLLKVLDFLDKSLGFDFVSLLSSQSAQEVGNFASVQPALQTSSAPEAEKPDPITIPVPAEEPETAIQKTQLPTSVDAPGTQDPEQKVLNQKASDRLEHVTAQLKARYGASLPLDLKLFQLADDNPNLPIKEIHDWALEAYGETGRFYLKRMGILSGFENSRPEREGLDLSTQILTGQQSRQSHINPWKPELESKQGVALHEVKASAGQAESDKLQKLGDPQAATTKPVAKQPDNMSALKTEPNQKSHKHQVPSHLQKKLENTLRKLRGFYPDGEVKDLYQVSKKSGEAVAFLTRSLGFSDREAFLNSQGFTLLQSAGGSPVSNDYEQAIERLTKYYRQGPKHSTMGELIKDHPELPLKSMANQSINLYGMSLGAYLRKLGILGSPGITMQEPANDSAEILENIIRELKKRYQGTLPLQANLKKLSDENLDLKLSSLNVHTQRVYKISAMPFLVSEGILQDQQSNTKSSKQETKERLEELTQRLMEKYGDQLPMEKTLSALAQENPDLRISSINSWAYTVHQETAKTYLLRVGILKKKAKKIPSYKNRYDGSLRLNHDLPLKERLSNQEMIPYISSMDRLHVKISSQDVQERDASTKEAALWLVMPVKKEAGFADGLYLLDYLGHAENVVVPVSIAGVPVVGIAQAAFQACRARKISIPGRYSELPALAFFNNIHLKAIKLGKGMESINQTALLKASSLRKLEMHGEIIWTGCDDDEELEEDEMGMIEGEY